MVVSTLADSRTNVKAQNSTPHRRHTLASLASFAFYCSSRPAAARIPTEVSSSNGSPLAPQTRDEAVQQLLPRKPASTGGQYIGRAAARSAPPNSTQQANDALNRLFAARTAVDEGKHDEALQQFTYIVDNYPDFALTEYARIGRALMLYQSGDTSRALLELEDEEVVMKGAAEVHTALAALMYTERPLLRRRAEEEWAVACAFDTRYTDTEWVRKEKHWPPKMIAALNKFLNLQ